jgi:Integrase core domain.
LWHVDRREIKDPRWKDLWLIVYEDDSSRFIVGYGVYPTPTSKYSVDVLRKAISMYGKPEEILSDHGTTFYAVESDERDKGLTEFEKFLIKEKITLIVGRVDRPQTNGKVEKFFDIFEKKVKFFNSVDDFMDWYNFIRLHGAFDIERLETSSYILSKAI